MVCGDDLYSAFLQSLDDPLPVFFRPERRIHLGQGTVDENVLFRQSKMMGRRLRRHTSAFCPGISHEINGFGRTDMLYIHRCPGLQRQPAVSFHHHRLRFIGSPSVLKLFGNLSGIDSRTLNIFRIFLVKADRNIKFCRSLHSLADDFFIHERKTVICKSQCPVGFQLFHVHEFFPFKTFGYRRSLDKPDRQLLCPFQNVIQYLCTVHHRLCICHTNHCGDTSVKGRPASCLHIFFVCKSRVSEMHMDIDQTRSHDHAFCVYDLFIISCFCISYTFNLSIGKNKIGHFIKSGFRVHDSSVFN